jgi:hypothetical protein
MAFRVINNTIFSDSLEVDVVDHCNIRCRSCDHISPIAAKAFVDPDKLEGDLSLLAKCFHARWFYLVGGEPMLHPRLSTVANAVRRSGIADKIILLTNGLLLHRGTEELWQSIDRVEADVYPGREPSAAAFERVRQASQARKFDLSIKPVKAFSVSYSELPNDDPRLVQRIYNTCGKRECFSVWNGYFYKCPIAHAIATRVVKQNGWGPEQDGVKLDDPDTLLARLRIYLEDLSPLKACRYCLGTVGMRHVHEQLPRSKWRVPQVVAPADSIDWSWLFFKEHRIVGRMGMHLYRFAKPFIDPTIQMEAETQQPWRTVLAISAKIGLSKMLTLRTYYVVRTISDMGKSVWSRGRVRSN